MPKLCLRKSFYCTPDCFVKGQYEKKVVNQEWISTNCLGSIRFSLWSDTDHHSNESQVKYIYIAIFTI